MSAISFAKAGVRVFSREKPHSSITNLVDILTSNDYDLEAYDGIPELADSINLQGTGPTEASRALRKKLKHGNPHQQYRSMVILKALVDNCGHRFQTTFADDQLTEALKYLACEPSTDLKVRKKVVAVLASWHTQFKDEPSMTHVAGLFRECRVVERSLAETTYSLEAMGIYDTSEADKKKAEREEAKKAKKEAKKEEERKRKEREAQLKRPPFVFAKEKPQVLNAIANASQASSNLVNAIKLVKPEKDTLQANQRVQECLAAAREARKAVVRYIQLVEAEEIIGTLLEANDRIVSALDMYDRYSSPNYNPAAEDSTPGDTDIPQENEDAFADPEDFEDQSAVPNPARIHSDLEGLSFGPLGDEQKNLPPPLRPSAPRRDSSGAESDPWKARGSLSDLSDYESSDEETHNATAGPSRRKARRSYVNVSDDPEDDQDEDNQVGNVKNKALDDPFSDPFA